MGWLRAFQYVRYQQYDILLLDFGYRKQHACRSQLPHRQKDQPESIGPVLVEIQTCQRPCDLSASEFQQKTIFEKNYFKTMRIALSIWMFYKKLIIPTLSMSAMTGFLTFMNSNSLPLAWRWSWLSFITLTPFFQYFIYEVRNPNEYYFYLNMGISKLVLWISTLILSLFIRLIMLIL